MQIFRACQSVHPLKASAVNESAGGDSQHGMLHRAKVCCMHDANKKGSDVCHTHKLMCNVDKHDFFLGLEGRLGLSS